MPNTLLGILNSLSHLPLTTVLWNRSCSSSPVREVEQSFKWLTQPALNPVCKPSYLTPLPARPPQSTESHSLERILCWISKIAAYSLVRLMVFLGTFCALKLPICTGLNSTECSQCSCFVIVFAFPISIFFPSKMMIRAPIFTPLFDLEIWVFFILQSVPHIRVGCGVLLLYQSLVFIR